MDTLTSSVDVRRAWIGVAFIPVGFVLAFVVGEGLYSALGYDAGAANEPLWVLLLVALVALPLFLAPCAAAVVYGRRAQRSGDRRGLPPYVIGGVVGAWLLLTTLAGVIGGILR